MNNDLYEIPTERSLEIWFKRWFSTCRNCGSLLTEDNAYSRNDTFSHLHNYCKTCYIEIQKVRNASYVKLKDPPIILIKSFGHQRIVMFDDNESKQSYIKERNSLAKFSRSCKEYSSVVGCTENWNKDRPLSCDQCGGLLKYDDHGDLVCTVCYLIADNLPVSIERNINFERNGSGSRKLEATESAFWSDTMSNIDDDSFSGTFDFYFSKAYSKHYKR